MTQDTAAARAARARELREQIDKLAGGKPKRGKTPAPAGDATPAEFIKRKMNELDSKK
jgi:hypothetical protein